MNNSRVASLLLAAFLQVAPFALRMVETSPALAASPAAVVLKWVIGALALSGAYHTVSAATAVLQSSTSIAGTTGNRLSYQIKINDGRNRLPGSYVIGGQTFNSSGGTTTNGLPPGLALSLATGIISGIPSLAGEYSMPISAYENPNRGKARLDFTLHFSIASGVSPPAVVLAPSPLKVHPGEAAVFSVGVGGTGPFTYQWARGGQAIAGGTTSTLSLPVVAESDAGDFSVRVTSSIGSVETTPVSLTVLPIRIDAAGFSSGGFGFAMRAIVGRSYVVESSPDTAMGWALEFEFTATEDPVRHLSSGGTEAIRFWRYRSAD